MKYELTFKTDKGLYKNFTKEFNSEQHRDNFISKIEREYWWKHIGSKPLNLSAREFLENRLGEDLPSSMGIHIVKIMEDYLSYVLENKQI